MTYYQTIVYSPGVRTGEAPPDGFDEIVAALSASEAAFEVVPDICRLAAEGDPAMRRWSAATDLRIAGLPRRAVKWLFHAAGQTLPETAEVLDTKKTAPDEVVRRLLAVRLECGGAAAHGQVLGNPDGDAHATAPARAMTVVLHEGPGSRVMTPQRRAELVLAAVAAGYRVVRPAAYGSPPAETSARAIVGEFEGGKIPPELAGAGVVRIDADGKCACGAISAVDNARAALGLPRPGEWAPWFPVIDYDRCTDCRQCANFCLFGVFSTDDGGVRVANPASCKTNCPACARMCPSAAIIFPHYPGGPINGQEAVEPSGGGAATSLKEALRGDVYQVLRSRQGGAASPSAAKEAVVAGNRCPAGLADLAKVAEQLEIPPQVLMSLGVSGASAAAGCNCECGADAAREVAGLPADESPADCQCDCDRVGQAEGDNRDCDCDCDCDETPIGSGRCCCQSDGGQEEDGLQ
jgi:NAD-dependent dihydropyrimidine dehydrogenase PreA subunit